MAVISIRSWTCSNARWAVKIVDGLVQHVSNFHTMRLYYDAKILLVKEEADSSQVNQMFDQLVARNDKRVLRECLVWLNNNTGMCKGKLTSWDLCHVALA